MSGGLLGQRHELHGRDVAEHGVPPAQQRLDRHRPLQHQVDDRLEHQAQLAAARSAPARSPRSAVAAVLLQRSASS